MIMRCRTFVGVSKDNKKVYLFVIDGRQPEYSNGMLLEDMMLLCQGAGCYQALNLDGGGSTGMVVGDEHLNDMTGGNRAVVSTIGFFKKN